MAEWWKRLGGLGSILIEDGEKGWDSQFPEEKRETEKWRETVCMSEMQKDRKTETIF